jgi:hypothetical protein
VSYRRLFLIILGTIGIASFFLSFPYFYALERNSPNAPVRAMQQISELSDHGYLFYVTRDQSRLFHILVWGGWSLVALAAVLNYRWKVIHNLGPAGWHLPNTPRARARPSKHVYAVGALLATVFVVVGIVSTIYLIRLGAPWFAIAFAIVWTLGCAVMCAYHCTKLFSFSAKSSM